LRGQQSLAGRGRHRGPTPVDLLIAAVFDLIARATGRPAEWLARRGNLD
jgi:hypothetical protein